MRTDAAPSEVSHGEPASAPGGRTFKDGVRKVAKAGFAASDLLVAPPRGPRLLIYHQVGAGNGRQMDLDPGLFPRQVEWLEEFGQIIGFESALETADEPDSSRRFVITVDDGYADFFENGFPLLRERGIPFTLYLTTSPIETGEPLKPGDRPLDWDQVSEMLDTGLVTLGAHTHTHPDLRGMSAHAVEDELGTSNDIIKRRTGQAPRHFAYPKGYWDETAEGAVKKYYDTAVLGSAGPLREDTDPYRIPRLPVQLSDGYFLFTRRVKRGLRLEEKLRHLLRGYNPPPA